MKFQYKRFGPRIRRPIIGIEVEYGETSIPYEVLVDSGADRNIFDLELGEALGLDVYGAFFIR